MEMLAYRTPPTCIQACLYAMAKTLFPHYDIVLELPSLTHIKNLRTTLWEVSKTLACYQLGHAKDWKQAHTDETRRRQTSLVNLLISFLDSDNELKTICLNGAIMCDDGTADSQCRGIISTLHDSAKLLKRWRYATLNMYPSNPDLVELIPDPATMDITRMTGGGLAHDTCDTARSLGNKLASAILESSNQNNILTASERKMYQTNCFQHLRNIWMGAVEDMMAKKLGAHLKHDLELIPPHLRVACRLSELVLQTDKEYNDCANYAKGSGDDYHGWRQRYRPGKRYLPVIRVAGGTRQDSAFEGALPVYDGLDDMLAFTHECLLAGENLLQRALFLALGSMEVIGHLRCASIIHCAIVIPLRWLTGNTHKLSHRQWGERSMGRAVDLLYSACHEFRDNGELFLDYDFMMSIFSPLYEKLPEFREYMEFFFEQKEMNVIGSLKKSDRILGIDEAMVELFMPTRQRNRQTHQFCCDLAIHIAVTIMTEMEDTRKATHLYLSHAQGEFSQAVISDKEEKATFGMRASNDPSEGMFATFTDVLCNGGRISLASAAGIGQARYNHDYYRGHELLVGNKTKRDDPVVLGTFHQLPIELQDSLLACCKRACYKVQQAFAEAIERQRNVRSEKKKLITNKKLENAERALIDASYLFQQFFSPRCWKTIQQALDEFEKLITKKDRLRCVKEQILIRYLGLGWEEAYHPWSKNKHIYEPSELLEHLVTNVIPLQDTKEIPDKPPLDLPKRPDNLALGTKSAGLIELDDSLLQQGQQIRIKAMKERDRLESNGFGDQLNELQETSWPVERILKLGFKIDMCFLYRDDEGNEMLQWCQGVVERIVNDKSNDKNYIIASIKWNNEFVDEGGANPTKEMFKKKDYNPEKHYDRAWREDLRHLLGN
jgi:hypothetical protein